MTNIESFPIPSKVLNPADYPEFVGQPGPATEWQTSATHLQARPVGAEVWVNVVALDAIRGPAGESDLSPIASYTETGATLAFVAEESGDIEIPLDGKVYALTITGDCSLAAVAPTAPESGSAVVYILIDTATPPVISIPATWHWPDATATDIPTVNASRAELILNSTPQGWIIARVTSIGVPA